MAKNTIKVKNYSDVNEEIGAGGTITPGMLVELGSAGTVTAHANAGKTVLPMFAVEDELQGGSIDDDYSSGDKVGVWIPGRGDQVYALLADGQTAVIGDFLESNGDGYLKVWAPESSAVTDTPFSVVGQATEALDLSGSSGEETTQRIIVRII